MKSKFILKLVLISIGSIQLLGCDPAQELEKRVAKFESAKRPAQGALRQPPYRRAQYEKVETYFQEFTQLAYDLKKDENLRKGLNEALKNSNLPQVCARIFMSRSEVNYLASNCKKDRYFLCDEHFKQHTFILNTIRANMTPEVRAKFNATAACIYGV